MFFNKLAPKVSYQKYLVIFSKKHQIQIFPNLIKLSFWKSNIPKFYWSVYDTNPNNTKYVWGPPNTEIFKVFSVFESTKCSCLVGIHFKAWWNTPRYCFNRETQLPQFSQATQVRSWGYKKLESHSTLIYRSSRPLGLV